MKKLVGIPMLLGALALAAAVSAGEANLTRFGPKVYQRESSGSS